MIQLKVQFPHLLGGPVRAKVACKAAVVNSGRRRLLVLVGLSLGILILRG